MLSFETIYVSNLYGDVGLLDGYLFNIQKNCQNVAVWWNKCNEGNSFSSRFTLWPPSQFPNSPTQGWIIYLENAGGHSTNELTDLSISLSALVMYTSALRTCKKCYTLRRLTLQSYHNARNSSWETSSEVSTHWYKLSHNQHKSITPSWFIWISECSEMSSQTEKMKPHVSSCFATWALKWNGCQGIF